jgi:hypothetical protein
MVIERREVPMVLTPHAMNTETGAVRLPCPEQDDRLWDSATVSAHLYRPERTLRTWRSKGIIPVVIDPGGHFRYRAGSIRALAREDHQLDQGSLWLPEPEDDDRMWDDAACGALLGRSISTVKAWRWSRLIPAVRDPSGAWRFRAGDIRQMIRDAEGWML